MAAKTRSPRPSYKCTECGWTAVKWVGRCGECQAWGTVVEAGVTPARTAPAAVVERPAQPIGEVDATRAEARSTGVGEFDRVLGGGLVPGAVVLVAGEPGIGKSTLLLDVAARAARESRSVLYVSGEESAAQVRMRAERIEAIARTLYLAAETDLATVLGQIGQVEPDLVVIDSVQTITSAEVDGAPGNVSQVREVAASIIQHAKARGIAVLLVGHVTKDGSIAGPRVLEHLVDVVVQFEGERHSRLRLVRAVKNRFGPTDEVGCFDLSEVGIVGLPDPSGLFLTRRDQPVSGTGVTVTLEGRRPLVAEVQALVAPGGGGSARRTTSGLESSRAAMVLAVLESRVGIRLRDHDCYLSTVGGVRIAEPASDLAMALAVVSASSGRPLPAGCIAVGEVGLAGDVRAVGGVPRRLAEAARIGFTRAIIPRGSLGNETLPAGMRVIEVDDLASAVDVAQPSRTG
ncbi:DNA repair protein RadA/Sms [Barrientosiimonas humi]|uniref:DNA repair protein RadA n=2 Tax=Barrientosiimonas TaxID=1535207 RepID=A0A542X822_9MICO|nr:MULTISPECIES: DNA repair protein RadA [Barrientosiimonas]TQL31982.1 DNA repair protein RadA/Sms [Barrientosiimonas humi]BDZ56690.1 DNA repair protein RadA [Barrientosiimonas endolithica]CAG7571854.1 DNA repair protein RadA [Barrientosiimonas humi]